LARADAIPSLVPKGPGDSADHTAFRPYPARCPEIDCVRHLLPSHVTDRAEAHAIKAGVRADSVLITCGLVSEETYVAALAASLGLEFEPLFNTPREACRLSDGQLVQAANTGLLPLQDRSGSRFVVAPRLVDSRRLVSLATSGAALAQSIRLTSTTRLHDFVTRHTAQEIEHRAAHELRTEHPELSAGVGVSGRLRILGLILLALAAAAVAPTAAMMAAEFILGVVFLAWTGLRLLGLVSESLSRWRQPRRVADHELPTYSIVVALYREAAAVPGLAAALRARLARFGYRTAVIPSTTYEEAPAHFGPWLKQRTRWFKGWMQTWLVHMRSPVGLYRELGPAGFIVFRLLVGGSALAAVVHVPFALRIIWVMTTTDGGLFSGFTGFDATALVSGYLISATLGLIGLGRRRLLGCAWALLFMPVYWLLLSLAAWRALLQLLRNPYLWEKTEHGLARTSRLDPANQR
jgi:hypothetical protein